MGAAFINSWYLSLWDACKLVQRLGDCSMPVFKLTNCKTAYTCLLHHVVALCCGVVPMGLLNSLIAWPGDPDGCLNSPLMPTTPSHLLPIHPSYMHMVFFPKFEYNYLFKNKQILSHMFVYWKLMDSCISSATWVATINYKEGWMDWIIKIIVFWDSSYMVWFRLLF